MTTSNNSVAFSQYLSIGHVGTAFATREDTRPSWRKFFHFETHREGDTCDDAGYEVKGRGAIRAFTLNVGCWVLIVDRPRVGNSELGNVPLTWNQTAWLALAAPVVASATLLACLFGGLFNHFLGKPLGLSSET